MSIMHNGNVGIGKTSPTKKLHVKGNFFVENPDREKGMLHAHTTETVFGNHGCTFLDVGYQGDYVPTSTGPSTAIRLGGRYLDQGFDQCVIENNVYQLDERSELLLFKGNDLDGQDRIRLLSSEILSLIHI